MATVEHKAPDTRAQEIGSNLGRVLARLNVSVMEAATITGLDYRTINSILRARKRPRYPTIHKIAETLGVDVQELLAGDDPRFAFDRATNPVVAEVVDANPKLFANWKQADFRELFSRRGVGGELTEEGVLHFAKLANDRRELTMKFHALLETSHGQMITDLINVTYERVRVTS